MSTGPALPADGDVLASKYRIARKIGGVVYEAVDVTTEARVAVRLLRLDPERKDRLVRELRASVALRSPFVARVLDVAHEADAQPLLVTELLAGHDLGAELAKVGRLPVGVAASYIVQACAGLAEAQAVGIVHGGLEPKNLFLDTTAGAEPTIRILDFGLAGAGAADARSDVQALGFVLQRALAGESPPEWLASALAKALAKRPEDRHPDARSFGRALAPHLSRMTGPTALAVESLASASPARSTLGAPRGSKRPPARAPDADDESTTQPTLDPAVRPKLDEPKTQPTPSDRQPTMLFEDDAEKDTTADLGKQAQVARDIIAGPPSPRVAPATAPDLSALLASTLHAKPKTAADLSDLLAPAPPRPRVEAPATPTPPRPRVDAPATPTPAEPRPPKAAPRLHVSFVLAGISVLALIAALITAWVKMSR